MLSETERRRLEELDELLGHDDPSLADACKQMILPPKMRRRTTLLTTLCTVLAIGALIGAAPLAEPALVALGLLASAAALLLRRTPPAKRGSD